MKFSELWLREWVNPAMDSTALAEQITMSGLPVKSIDPVAGSFSGVVIGQVRKCQQHPHTNKLCINKVDIGGERLLDIVCCDPNCRTDLRVVVAITGALLPVTGKITPHKLLGALSEGMLCSFSELGISYYDDYSRGIIELPADAPIGLDIRDYLQLNDNMIDISVTPNRADCLGLLGIARDVAVRNRIDLKLPVIDPVIPLVNDNLPIKVEATEACPCYMARVIKNINISADTPLWMKEKLRRCGIRLVDAVVDITNYVLVELGQPMQVFDRASIDSGIFIRQARPDESLKLLAGSDIMLSSDTLVIADNSKVLAIAGIFVGGASDISSSTSDIVLTCAYFHPLAINGRAQRYCLHTEASHRYERGVDPALPPQAIERATWLLMAICGGQPGPVINVTTASKLHKPAIITLRRKALDRLIGYTIANQDISDILLRLGCQVSSTEEGWQATPPSWRFDLVIEEDLIEEVARLYGYEAIPNMPIRANLAMLSHREAAALPLSRVKMLLVDRGYQEAITYSFVDPQMQSLLYPQPAPLLLPSPISPEMSAMRLSLWTGLIGAVVYNQNRQQQRIRLFESGMCFIPDNTAELGIRQDLMLAGVITGSLFKEHWDLVRRPVDFYDVKGDLECILELTGKMNHLEFKAQHHLALHPGQSAAIYLQDELIGFIGVINPMLEAKLHLNGRTLVFELLWEKVAARLVVPRSTNNISRFPANRRDIAVVVADHIAATDILTECKSVLSNHLVDINLFDVYRGQGVAEGCKSLSIRLVLQDNWCTLEEADIAATVAKCVAALKQRFQASLR